MMNKIKAILNYANKNKMETGVYFIIFVYTLVYVVVLTKAVIYN